MKTGVSVLLALVLTACTTTTEPTDEITTDDLLGGPMTISDASAQAFGFPAPFLDATERQNFVVGNAFFRTNWITAPATTTSRDGLGPTYHSASCSGCHLRDGRGRFEPGEPLTGGLLIRLSTAHGSAPEPTYGYQLATQSILGVPAEAQVIMAMQTLDGVYEDGTPYQLQRPTVSFHNLGYGPMVASVEVSPRLAQQLIGLGLLESISEETLTAIVHEQSQQGRGVSGRVHYVTDRFGATVVGRFGWKATQPSVSEQTAHAFAGDIGITTPIVMHDDLTPAQIKQLGTLADGGAPECEEDAFDAVVFYTAMLGVPRQRSANDAEIKRGKQLFSSVGCADCHRVTVRTGTSSSHPMLSAKEIHPYTDLLLHDMGADLADHRPDKDASGTEWRTPPLWGIGLAATVGGGPVRFLHDGRAGSIEEAILWHGGEASHSTHQFRSLSATQRAELIAFVFSL